MHRLQDQARLLDGANKIGSWRHLIGRFFRVVIASRLTPREREWVEASLDLGHDAFFAQGRADQRHAYESARRVGDAPSLIRAALLHDIGKRHAQLSPIGRALATAAAKLGLKPGGRGAIYLQHGRLGAEELRAMGAEQLVVDFAGSHHSDRPATISPPDWEVLVRADH